jgi:hypothetical protein
LLNAYSHERQVVTFGTVFKSFWELRELPTLGRAKEYQPSDTSKKHPSNRKPAAEETSPLPDRPTPAPTEPAISSLENSVDEPETPAAFDLGKELRQELNDDVPVAIDSDVHKELSLLHRMTEEMNNPDLQSDIVLLVLRFAAEFLNRSVVFMIQDMTISGVGQFGVDGDTISGDERVRAINFSLDAGSMFRTPCRTARASTFKPEQTPVNRQIFEQLGGVIPEEAFIGPIVSRSRVIGFLYGDNLPEAKRIGRTESLEIFLSQAGVALEKMLLEQRLQERQAPVRQGRVADCNGEDI